VYLKLSSIIILFLAFWYFSIGVRTHTRFVNDRMRTYEGILYEYTHSQGHHIGLRALPHRGASSRANLRRITDTISSESGPPRSGPATIRALLLQPSSGYRRIQNAVLFPMIYNIPYDIMICDGKTVVYWWNLFIANIMELINYFIHHWSTSLAVLEKF